MRGDDVASPAEIVQEVLVCFNQAVKRSLIQPGGVGSVRWRQLAALVGNMVVGQLRVCNSDKGAKLGYIVRCAMD